MVPLPIAPFFVAHGDTSPIRGRSEERKDKQAIPGPHAGKFAVQDTLVHQDLHRRLWATSATHESNTRHYVVVVSYIPETLFRSLPTQRMPVVEDAR